MKAPVVEYFFPASRYSRPPVLEGTPKYAQSAGESPAALIPAFHASLLSMPTGAISVYNPRRIRARVREVYDIWYGLYLDSRHARTRKHKISFIFENYRMTIPKPKYLEPKISTSRIRIANRNSKIVPAVPVWAVSSLHPPPILLREFCESGRKSRAVDAPAAPGGKGSLLWAWSNPRKGAAPSSISSALSPANAIFLQAGDGDHRKFRPLAA